RGRHRHDRDVEPGEVRRVGGGVVPARGEHRLELRVGDVVDERLAALEQLHAALVGVVADHVVADLDRPHRERQPDVALPDHDGSRHDPALRPAPTYIESRYQANVRRTPSSSGTRGSKPVSARSFVRSGARRATAPGGAGSTCSSGAKSASLSTSLARSAMIVSVSVPMWTISPKAASVPIRRTTASVASST